MHREMGRPSLAESLLPETLGQNVRLERIDDAVDWDRFSALVAGVYSAGEGRPSYPPLTMVKVLLLEQWYNLSDPQMEETLGDRISFRRFVGLGLQDDTPDYSTISRFRAELEKRGLSESLFKELETQLDEMGLILKEGTLMDATRWKPRCADRRPRRVWGPRVRQTRMRTGPGAVVRGGPTLAIRCIWGWSLGRGWCAGRF